VQLRPPMPSLVRGQKDRMKIIKTVPQEKVREMI
jgi:hypothetical protein